MNPLLTCLFHQLEMLLELKTAGTAGVQQVRPASEEAFYPVTRRTFCLNNVVFLSGKIEIELSSNAQSLVCT